jgi:cysteinyl-tRNA synthetase
MSKSLKNFFLVRDVLQRYSGEVIRFYLLSTHYRSPALFDQEKLEEAAKGLERLRTSVRLADECLAQGQGGPAVSGAGRVRQLFEEAMDDDFNSAQALAVLFDLAREINLVVSRPGPAGSAPERGPEPKPGGLPELAAMRDTLVALAGVLGFAVAAAQEKTEAHEASADGLMSTVLELYERARADRDEETVRLILRKCLDAGVDVQGAGEEGSGYQALLEAARAAGVKRAFVMDMLLELRSQARSAKNWPVADLIRDRCKANGIVIEDRRDGARWYEL